MICQKIRPVDIAPVLAVLDRLRFVPVNVGSTNPAKSPCFVPQPGLALPDAIPQFVDGLGLGGTTARILVRKLGPRQGMAPHVDEWMGNETDWRRFQVPLVTDPSVTMNWPEAGVSVHLEAGWLYEVRFDRLHQVVNNWDGERIHLQIDQVGATI